MGFVIGLIIYFVCSVLTVRWIDWLEGFPPYEDRGTIILVSTFLWWLLVPTFCIAILHHKGYMNWLFPTGRAIKKGCYRIYFGKAT